MLRGLTWHLPLRLILGIIFLVHGLPKLTAPATVAARFVALGAPSGLWLPVGLTECLAAIAMLCGLAVRAGAVTLAIVMVGAIGFKVGRGFAAIELDLALLAMALALALGAGGSGSPIPGSVNADPAPGARPIQPGRH